MAEKVQPRFPVLLQTKASTAKKQEKKFRKARTRMCLDGELGSGVDSESEPTNLSLWKL